jgi:nucleotide-binding universal stress UspA family protein
MTDPNAERKPGPVVVGVDGTDSATRAADTAARLASALGARLHVVSAYGSVSFRSVRAEGFDASIDHVDAALEVARQASGALSRAFPSLEVEASAAEGRPGEALVQVADTVAAAVIVIGNKRVQGMTRILGSVATDVAQQASCDVYIAYTHE